MPELPEVETVRKQLERELVGLDITGVEVRDQRCYDGIPWQGRETIVSVGRVGKYLFVHFLSGRGMQIHLKMTGRLILSKSANLQVSKSASQQVSEVVLDYDGAKHTRVVMQLSDGRSIYYWDIRMFGYIRLENNLQNSIHNLQKKMGPEPWEISDKELLAKLKRTRRPIKEAILDQNLLAGVGNIYANDGLWLAGIDPRRIASSLRPREVAKLRKSLCSVLERGLSTGGASDNTYRDFYGGRGSYQDEFLVYGRTGEACGKCGKKLERIVVGGRGTWVCGECQE